MGCVHGMLIEVATLDGVVHSRRSAIMGKSRASLIVVAAAAHAAAVGGASIGSASDAARPSRLPVPPTKPRG